MEISYPLLLSPVQMFPAALPISRLQQMYHAGNEQRAGQLYEKENGGKAPFSLKNVKNDPRHNSSVTTKIYKFFWPVKSVLFLACKIGVTSHM
eukprot:397425-Rhodomonas_salina.1